ncbi:hypothetical protein PTKIN_Ptkin12aG0029200 [Pterospermum kingtungense]
MDVEQGRVLAGNWGYNFCNRVSSIGQSGGLLIIWDESVSVSIYSMNKNLIHVYISDNQNKFWVSCIYGHPKTHLRYTVWNQLITFKERLQDNEEWIVMGDFNQVLETKDKLSFKDTNIRGAELLRECPDSCMLSEVPPAGQYFTWTNNREGEEGTWERIDRCFASHAWFENHGKATLYNLPIVYSDHGAFVLSTEEQEGFTRRPYRFEAMWLTNNECEDVVRAAWNNDFQGSPAYVFVQKLKKEKEIRKEIQVVAEQEQIFWMQKSRINWILYGDRNTKFYHAVTTRRRIRNRITGIYTLRGTWRTHQQEIKEAFVEHFKDIYNQNEELDMETLRNKVEALNPPRLNDAQQEWLS